MNWLEFIDKTRLCNNHNTFPGFKAEPTAEILIDASADGATVLFSTHVMQHAERLCDQIAIIAGGKVVADGTPAEALTADLIGAVWNVSARWLGEPGARALAIV